MKYKFRTNTVATSSILALWAADHFEAALNAPNPTVEDLLNIQGKLFMKWSNHILDNPLDNEYPDKIGLSGLVHYSDTRKVLEEKVPFRRHEGSECERDSETEIAYLKEWATRRCKDE